MKVEIKSYKSKSSLVSSIAFLVVGALLFTSADTIVKWLSYIIGGLLILWGIFNAFRYYKAKKSEIQPTTRDLAIAVTLIVIGILCIFLAGVIETAFRLVIGAWVLFTGISRLISALSAEDVKGKNNIILIIVAALLIVVGLYILLKSNLLFKGIGILIMVYAAIDIIGYVCTQMSTYDVPQEEAVVIEVKEETVIPEEPIAEEEPKTTKKKKSAKKKTTTKKKTTKKKEDE